MVHSHTTAYNMLIGRLTLTAAIRSTKVENTACSPKSLSTQSYVMMCLSQTKSKGERLRANQFCTLQARVAMKYTIKIHLIEDDWLGYL